MIKTTYICDKCHAEQPSCEQFWTVGLWAFHPGIYSHIVQESQMSMQVCRPCLESLGVHVRAETKIKPDYVERTTEDILRELIQRVQPKETK